MDDDLLQEMEAGNGPTPTDRARRRRLATTVAICGLAFIGFGQLSTGAFFTDQADASLTYTAGDVKIMANGVNSVTLTPLVNKAPGDVNYEPLTISATGALDLRYAITGVSDDTGTTSLSPLSSVLQYDIYSGVSNTSCAAKDLSTGTLITAPADQTIGTSEMKLVGDNATGQQPGDRSLLAGNSEPLCVVVKFPSTADNHYADGTVKVTLNFYAEQTANN